MNPLLDGRTRAQKIEDAIEFLRENGYVIVGPFVDKCDIKSPSQLVRFFYDTLARYKPRLATRPHNIRKERAIAKSFFQSRIDAGRGKKQALRECCELIEILFKYEDRLGLNFSVMSMGVLGQAEMGWVTEKLIKIKEGLNNEVNLEEDEKFFNRLQREQELEISKKQLKKAKKYMDGVLSRYAKEESEEGK